MSEKRTGDDMTLYRLELMGAIGHLEAEQETVNGLDVLEIVSARLDEDGSTARLYPNLDWLAEREYIEKERVDGRTNAYSLTEKGIEDLIFFGEWAWQAAPGPHRAFGQVAVGELVGEP